MDIVRLQGREIMVIIFMSVNLNEQISVCFGIAVFFAVNKILMYGKARRVACLQDEPDGDMWVIIS